MNLFNHLRRISNRMLDWMASRPLVRWLLVISLVSLVTMAGLSNIAIGGRQDAWLPSAAMAVETAMGHAHRALTLATTSTFEMMILTKVWVPIVLNYAVPTLLLSLVVAALIREIYHAALEVMEALQRSGRPWRRIGHVTMVLVLTLTLVIQHVPGIYIALTT